MSARAQFRTTQGEKQKNSTKLMIATHVKSTPLLFSTPMVQAIDEGIKTETRRILTPQLPIGVKWWKVSDGELLYRLVDQFTIRINCQSRFGMPGDQIWVKETWTDLVERKFPNAQESPNKDIYNYTYKAKKQPHVAELIKWKSSMFMPKKAARIFLEIEDIRVEQLQDINSAGALAEGIRMFRTIIGPHYALNEQDDCRARRPVESYRLLWSK